jgi:ATP11 protein
MPPQRPVLVLVRDDAPCLQEAGAGRAWGQREAAFCSRYVYVFPRLATASPASTVVGVANWAIVMTNDGQRKKHCLPPYIRKVYAAVVSEQYLVVDMFLLAATRTSAAAWAAAASSACAAARHQLLRQRCASTCTGVQPLADILKLPLLQDKTADEIEHIWLAAHADSSSHVASVMSSEEYGVLAARAIASPLFVLPLRKPPSGAS